MNKKQWIFLILILLLAVFLRFFRLGITPRGLYLDESALGYNAYSIIETGRDEYGKSLPILFRSFCDFKAPVYTYLLMPIYKIFGMTVWSTRMLSALMGVIGIFFAFLLVKNLSNKINLSLIVALLLAISPWHLIFSRTSYETNVAFTFFLISLWSFYKYQQNKKYLLLSAFMASLSFLTYHSERLIIPLVFLVLFIKERQNIINKKYLKTLICSLILAFLVILPTFKLMTTPGFLSRINSLSIFSSNIKQPWGFNANLLSFQNLFLNNLLILKIREFASLYSSYFSPRYLFGIGDSGPRSSYPDLAPFLFWQLPFWVFGLIWLFKKTQKEDKNLKFLLVVIMLISPIPASITRDPFSSIRALPLVLPLTILIAIGINKFLEKFKNIAVLILIALVMWSCGKIYLSVFCFNDYYRGWSWNEGIKEIVSAVQNSELPVVVDNARGEIYSQILFFTKANPETYQSNNFEVSLDEYYTNMSRSKTKIIGNITIREIVWTEDIYKKQFLVGDNLSIDDKQIKEHCLTKMFEIKGSDNKTIYVGVKTNPQLKKQKGSVGCF